MSIIGKRIYNKLNQSVSTNSIIIMDHQLVAYNFLKIKTNKSIMLYYGLGSGKTISSLYASIKLGKPTIIIGPKSSKKAFMDDLLKLSSILTFKIDDFQFYSYQKVINVLENNFDLFTDKIIIIDEAHHLRSQTRQMMFIINSLSLAYKIILLSGTPVINHPVDLCVLVNIIKNNEVITTDKSLFDFYYVESITNQTDLSSYDVKFKNIDELKQKLSNAISYYSPPVLTKNITVNVEYPKVMLSVAQLIEYKKYIVRLIHPITKHIVHLETDINADDFNIDFLTLETKKKNAFLTATRQLSNTINNDHNSPKIKEVVEHIVKGDKPVVVYSNFLANGIYPVSVALNKYNISFKIIKGSTTEEKMNTIINEYNERKFDVLLISSAASESITLLNTRQIHILEPHFNEAKINQVIGRAIRYKSHDKLPLNQRKILVYHWCSVFPDIIKYKTADEYLIWLGRKKQNLIDKFIDIVKTVSI
jgi:superfamily II DNA or RNA helicase